MRKSRCLELVESITPPLNIAYTHDEAKCQATVYLYFMVNIVNYEYYCWENNIVQFTKLGGRDTKICLYTLHFIPMYAAFTQSNASPMCATYVLVSNASALYRSFLLRSRIERNEVYHRY